MNFPSHNSLYLITSEEYSAGKTTLEVAEAAISAGIDIIQMREKTLSYAGQKQLGKKLSTLCKSSSIVFIANDSPVLAKEINADGVHLGQEDIQQWPIAKVREILGPDKIIGISTHSLKEIEQANDLDINYIAFGPIFATKTKNYCIGTKDIAKALKVSKFPVVCIGGLTEANIETVLGLGCDNIAMIGTIAESQNVYNKVRELKKIINRYRRQS
jgi:thiamine-phosphate pyrophosphorylase